MTMKRHVQLGYSSVTDLTARLGRHRNTVGNWLREGLIPMPTHVLKVGGRPYYSEAEVVELCEKYGIKEEA